MLTPSLVFAYWMRGSMAGVLYITEGRLRRGLATPPLVFARRLPNAGQVRIVKGGLCDTSHLASARGSGQEPVSNRAAQPDRGREP